MSIPHVVIRDVRTRHRTSVKEILAILMEVGPISDLTEFGIASAGDIT